MNEIEIPLYRSFVEPTLCHELMLAGLTAITKFKWRIKNNHGVLYTNEFDTDKYYINGQLLIDNITPPDMYISAFQITDLSKIIPDFYLSKVNNKYELMCDNIYGVLTHTSSRMPDVFAKMVLEGIIKKIILIDNANVLIKM